jgi:hypothetical protein
MMKVLLFLYMYMGFLQVDGNGILWIEVPLQQQNRMKTTIIS